MNAAILKNQKDWDRGLITFEQYNNKIKEINNL